MGLQGLIKEKGLWCGGFFNTSETVFLETHFLKKLSCFSEIFNIFKDYL